MKKIVLGILIASLAAAGGSLVLAQSTNTANVEIRVWEDADDPAQNFVSARPEGGSWRTIGTIPIPLTSETSSGRFKYGDITLEVPLPARAAPVRTEQSDIEIKNLRCESQNPGGYFSDDDRTLRGTIRNISDVPLTDITIYASLFSNGSGVRTKISGTYDDIPVGSEWNFEIHFNVDSGDTCKITRVEYGRVFKIDDINRTKDFQIQDRTCGLYEESTWFSDDVFSVKLTNISGSDLSSIRATASMFGTSDVETEDDYVSRLEPGEETILWIEFDHFTGDPERCNFDILRYTKEIQYLEDVPYEQGASP